MRSYISCIILIIVSLGFSGCKESNLSDTINYPAAEDIPDWNMIYPLLSDKAKAWDLDAGLRLAALDVGSNKASDMPLVSAIFVTPKDQFAYLYVQYFKDQSIKSKALTYNVPNSNFDLIYEGEWQINSTDALNIFLLDTEAMSFESNYFDCATLIILNKKFEYENEYTVVWELALDDCSRENTALFFIDAKSGDFIGQETH